MKQTEIDAMLMLKPSYNVKAKTEFRRMSRKFLTAVVKDLGLAKGTYDLRFNAGGIAVSGDAILHTDTFYVSFNLDGNCDWILVRTCKGRHDYLGGLNKGYDFSRLTGGVAGFCTWLRASV